MTLATATKDTGVRRLLPTPWLQDGVLYNAVMLAEDGEIVTYRLKRELPNNDVFYEKRYFGIGPLAEPADHQGRHDRRADLRGYLACGCVCASGGAGRAHSACPNGSPYWQNKHTRYRLVRDRVREENVPLLYLNQVGGQDEIVYDGASFGIEPGGRIAFSGASRSRRTSSSTGSAPTMDGAASMVT